MVRVKICGITSWGDAKLAVDAGAHALGFNFYGPSPRSVTPAQAWAMIRRLPPFVEAVGVFVNWSFDAVDALARAVRVHSVQLHGDEPPGEVAKLARAHPVIKAFRVRKGVRPAALARYRAATAFLLDGFSARLRGGTGQKFDWSVARQAQHYGQIILAGGLAPENIMDAIIEVEPFAVDVCSGVESRPGRKDPDLLRNLMRSVELANGVLHDREILMSR